MGPTWRFSWSPPRRRFFKAIERRIVFAPVVVDTFVTREPCDIGKHNCQHWFGKRGH